MRVDRCFGANKKQADRFGNPMDQYSLICEIAYRVPLSLSGRAPRPACKDDSHDAADKCLYSAKADRHGSASITGSLKPV